MGLEWHNRRRDGKGRFRDEQLDRVFHREERVQVHFRAPLAFVMELRQAANDQRKELGEYIIEACLARMTQGQKRQPKTVKPS